MCRWYCTFSLNYGSGLTVCFFILVLKLNFSVLLGTIFHQQTGDFGPELKFEGIFSATFQVSITVIGSFYQAQIFVFMLVE